MMKTQKIILPLKKKIRTGKYGVIYVPKVFRNLFPDYKVSFTLETDTGDVYPWITGWTKKSPDGCNIIGGGLLKWFRGHSLSPADNLEIEILKPYNKYKLSVLKGEFEKPESGTSDLISITEGGERVVISIQAERNPKLRKEAVKFHGTACKVCGFDFENKYGDWGKGFIEVHHLLPLGQSKKVKRDVNIKSDLTVLCSNCHKMVHRKREITLTIVELRNKLVK